VNRSSANHLFQFVTSCIFMSGIFVSYEKKSPLKTEYALFFILWSTFSFLDVSVPYIYYRVNSDVNRTICLSFPWSYSEWKKKRCQFVEY